MKDLLAKKNNLTYRDLVPGQTYVLSGNASFDKKNVYVFKFKDFKTTNYHSVYCYYLTKTEFGIINPDNGIFSEGSLFIDGRYMKKATHEEEYWLQECIKLNKFVSYHVFKTMSKPKLWKIMK